jgi:hypothetical protein
LRHVELVRRTPKATDARDAGEVLKLPQLQRATTPP